MQLAFDYARAVVHVLLIGVGILAVAGAIGLWWVRRSR